ncbi:MAG: chromosomal replication initiator protein DnaA [Brevinema sp.]
MELWNLLQQYLEQSFDDSFSRPLLKRIQFKEHQNDQIIVLSAEDSFTKGWFENTCVDILKEYLAQQDLHQEFRVDILTEKKRQEPPTEKTSEVSVPGLSLDYTFKNYIPGNCNDFPYKAAQISAETSKYNPLIITGPMGTGKTHLAQAIVHQFIQQSPQAKVVFVTSEDFTNDFIDHLQKKSMNNFRKKYRTCDLLIIDDIQGIQSRHSTTDELENIFNTLISQSVQMVFTSDRPIKKLKDLKMRLRTRLAGGLEVDLKNPDFETRKAILLDMVQKENHKIDYKIIDLIAETIDHNIRELKSTLMKLFAYADLKKKDISLRLTKEVLSDKIHIVIPDNISVSEIQKAVASYFGIKSSDIKSDSKLHSKSYPRQIAMFISAKYTKNTSTELGSLFNKSHSTVLRATQKIENEITKNTNLKKDIDKILLEISEVHPLY